MPLTGYSNTISVTTLGLLLDLYPSAAAAYSVRKLRSAYTGSAIRVRRSSDNAEQDIGFTALGNLDTTTLTSFCGAGNGFVTTWYDQSGNARNATQSTAANQPQIVSSGNVILNNGKSALQNTSDTQILYLTRTNLGTQHSFFAVIDYTSTGKEFLGDFGSGPPSWAFYQNDGQYGAQGVLGASNVALSVNQSLFELHRNGQTGIANYQNGSQSGTTFSLSSNNDFYLSNLGGESTIYSFIGYMQEAIIYPTIQFSNRSGIASNINSFYSIY